MQQAGRVDDILVRLAAADLDRQSLRVAGDRAGVLTDRLVTHVERPHERPQNAQLQPDQLYRARFQLFRAILGAQQRHSEVPEDQQQNDCGEQDRQACAVVCHREDRRERGCRELSGQ